MSGHERADDPAAGDDRISELPGVDNRSGSRPAGPTAKLTSTWSIWSMARGDGFAGQERKEARPCDPAENILTANMLTNASLD